MLLNHTHKSDSKRVRSRTGYVVRNPLRRHEKRHCACLLGHFRLLRHGASAHASQHNPTVQLLHRSGSRSVASTQKPVAAVEHTESNVCGHRTATFDAVGHFPAEGAGCCRDVILPDKRNNGRATGGRAPSSPLLINAPCRTKEAGGTLHDARIFRLGTRSASETCRADALGVVPVQLTKRRY